MRILVADDDDLVRDMMVEFMTCLGYKVSGVCNGAALLKMVLDERPDLVVTDLRMPEMSGDSVISMLGTNPGLNGIPVLVISAVSAVDLAGMGLPKEITVLPKPLDFDRVRIELERLSRNIHH